MTDTSRGIACYCPYRHSEAVAKVARATDTANRHMALDSADSLTRDINARFHPSNQMPVTTSPSAAMSTSMSDNYTGGAQYRRRNNTADQSATAGEELLRLIQQTLPNWSDPEIDAFVGALNAWLSGNGAEAEDQGACACRTRITAGAVPVLVYSSLGKAPTAPLPKATT